MTNQLKITNSGHAIYLLQHFSKNKASARAQWQCQHKLQNTYPADKKIDFLKNINQTILPSL